MKNDPDSILQTANIQVINNMNYNIINNIIPSNNNPSVSINNKVVPNNTINNSDNINNPANALSLKNNTYYKSISSPYSEWWLLDLGNENIINTINYNYGSNENNNLINLTIYLLNYKKEIINSYIINQNQQTIEISPQSIFSISNIPIIKNNNKSIFFTNSNLKICDINNSNNTTINTVPTTTQGLLNSICINPIIIYNNPDNNSDLLIIDKYTRIYDNNNFLLYNQLTNSIISSDISNL